MKNKILNSLEKICSSIEGVNKQTLEAVIILAIEIAREGREGRKVGTMFVVSDSKTVLKKSRCLILDPLKYHYKHRKHIENSDLRETVKELAQLDGAFIVSDAGIVESACRYIDASSQGISQPLGLGSRHMAAASITRETNSVAVVVSENSIVRIFTKGEIIGEIIPEIWLINNSSLHLEGAYSQHSENELTVISKNR